MLKRLAPYAFLFALTPVLVAGDCNGPDSTDPDDEGGGGNDNGDGVLTIGSYDDQTHGFGTDPCPTQLDDLLVSNDGEADLDVTVSADVSDQDVQTVEIGGPGATEPVGASHTETVAAGGSTAFTMWFNCGIAETNTSVLTVSSGDEMTEVDVVVEVTGTR